MLRFEIVEVPQSQVPEADQQIVVVERQSGRSPLERYLAAERDVTYLASRRPLAAIYRSATLSTPDQTKVVRARQDRAEFLVEVEFRCYEGQLAANVAKIVLVQVELGTLEAGDYLIRVMQSTFYYLEADHPEKVSHSSIGQLTCRFEVH